MKELYTRRVEDLSDLFDKISKDWMLIGTSCGGENNIMTASWGFFGYLWNRPMAACVIRPQRYTHKILENTDKLTLSFLPSDMRCTLALCGKMSGRQGDKFKAAGLSPVREGGWVYPAEAEEILLCKSLYVSSMDQSLLPLDIKKEFYPNEDYHTIYLCEIKGYLSAK